MKVGIDSKLGTNLEDYKLMMVNVKEHKPDEQVLFIECEISEELSYVMGCILVKVLEAAAKHVAENPPEFGKAVFG